MEELKVFENAEFGSVRTTTVNGEIMFVGKDVAGILGYSNPRKALADHVDEDDKTDGVTIRDPIGREQHPTVINESGLYSLALSCATGVAKSLGYAKLQKEVRDHCKGAVIRRLPFRGSSWQRH